MSKESLGKIMVAGLVAIMLGGAGMVWANLPAVRSMPELNEEAKIWIQQLEAVKASNQSVKANMKDPGGKEKIREIMGPYVPLEKISGVELNPDGSFYITFSKEHVIDLPTEDPKSDNKFIRGRSKPGKSKASS